MINTYSIEKGNDVTDTVEKCMSGKDVILITKHFTVNAKFDLFLP